MLDPENQNERTDPFPDKNLIASFPTCPICGCEETILGKAVQQEKLNGKIDIRAKLQACYQDLSTFIMDPQKPPLIGAPITQIETITDFCADCGVLRTVFVYRNEVIIPATGPGLMSNLGKPGTGFSMQ